MRITRLNKLGQSVIAIFVFCLTVAADVVPLEELSRVLPAEIGNYRATRAVVHGPETSEPTTVSWAGWRDYRSTTGERFTVSVNKARSDSGAFAVFQSAVNNWFAPPGTSTTSEIGTRSLLLPDKILFVKGLHIVLVQAQSKPRDRATLVELARSVASSLDAGEGDVPVLVKHLPDWPQVEPRALYAIDPGGLKRIVPNQSVVDEISFAGGTEAVLAPYGRAQMLLVEFTTPQLATENDQRIREKVQQLWTQGQPAPRGYRRVGNYSVFVFNAATNEEANQLIDQVKYEQVVQWLGDNPNWLKQAQKEYTETTLGVLVTVIKTSGLAAALCFGIGGFLGAVLFARRRARQINAEAYSDAGGMMRLNLDELSIQNDPGKLIGSGPPDKL